MVLNTPKRRERLLDWSDLDIGERLDKSERWPARYRSIVERAKEQRKPTWAEDVATFCQGLLEQTSLQGMSIREMTAKPWKGGVLLIVVARYPNQAWGKWFAWGATFTEMLAHAAGKASAGYWRLKD